MKKILLFLLFFILNSKSEECACCNLSDIPALKKEINELSTNLRHLRDELFKWLKYYNELIQKSTDEETKWMKFYLDIQKEDSRRKKISQKK